jgi:hypothetical protein
MALSSVAASASSVTLLDANPSRKGVVVFNDSTSAVYVAYAPTSSATSFTVKIAAAGFWEMPAPPYTDVLSAIWDAANGSARVTEQV